ncbi:MAG TPA: ROK family protein [Dissulfurispiraceae bacterium]|nr:ROK family protein [Dissulfurispiraceae bacterium]
MSNSKYVIGVDLGGTNIRAALVDKDGKVSKKAKEPAGEDPLSVLFKLLESVYAGNAREIGGIGIAVAGLIDSKNGVVMRSPNVPKLDGVNLKSEIANRYKQCVVVENDANAAAYGEKSSGAGKDVKNFVMFTLGTGIGAGIVFHDKLLPVAAEIGHMTINADGPQCPCGNVGCLELYASATAIISSTIAELEKGKSSILKEFNNGNFYKVKAKDIYNAALEGDPLARNTLREAGKSLGLGIANIINIMSPDAIILTGGLMGAWNIYIESAIKEASKRALKELYGKVRIIASTLGDDAGLIGAAHLISNRNA